MAIAGSLLLPRDLGVRRDYAFHNRPKGMMSRSSIYVFRITLSSHVLRQDAWSHHLLNSVHGPKRYLSSRFDTFQCRSFLLPSGGNEIPILKTVGTVLTRSCNTLCRGPFVLQLVSVVVIIAFSAWALGPLMRLSRILFLNKSDSSREKCCTQYVMTSYIQPLLLWAGAMLLCRQLDPIILPTEASQAVKQRLLNFIRSLSTMLTFAYCLSSLIQAAHKSLTETNESNDARNMGFQFAGKAVYTAVWVASVSLFMELLGFSAQKWLTAGGLGTVLLTLAGREIFTNFLSSVMIHATQPFVVNEWIQTKIEGYEVSGTVEHVGWWSPTIIRGDDREAIHIPNHKFTVTVVRNLSQKTHWRIKTYLAISHLDVNKINNIVADMRKVLAKNPQVEQQRLHRRVFLENINPDNQALMILVSCFVKTSHFEEYLCVKEAILLDLLRVIRHHRARLATPIRTVHKMSGDADIENIAFADTPFASSRAAGSRPLLLIEPSYKINGDNKTKAATRTQRANEGKDAEVESELTSGSVADVKGRFTSTDETKTDDKVAPAASMNGSSSSKVSAVSIPDAKIPNAETADSADDSEKQQVKKNAWGEMRKTSSDMPSGSAGESASEKPDRPSTTTTTPRAKQDGERATTVSQPVSRPAALEDNIVLGVALEGSKRTLPIEEEAPPSSVSNAEAKELAASSATDKKDDQMPTIPATKRSDHHPPEKER